MNTQFCSEEIRAIYWQGTKPGDWEVIAYNPISPMVFNQGFLKDKDEGFTGKANWLVLMPALVVFFSLINLGPGIIL